MSFQHLPPPPEGCKTVRAAALAKRLNVAYQLIEGLVIGGQVVGYSTQGKSGAAVLVVPTSEIKRLERLQEGRQ